MTDTIIRQCKICGSAYEYCYSCEKINSWKAHTDTQEHYYMLCVLMDYRGGKDAQSCYRALKKRGFDFADAENLLLPIRELLTEIYSKSHNGRELPIRHSAESAEISDVEAVRESEPKTE